MMSLKYVYVVIISIVVYAIFHSNNYYVQLVKSSIFKHSQPAEQNNKIGLYTLEELSKFTNVETGLYLAILGQIYDVTKGAKFYGQDGSYSGFIGRDASLAFITGDYSKTGLTDDLSSLSDQQILRIIEWSSFYDSNYIYKGKLIGRYYDEQGNPTKEYKKITDKSERAKRAKVKEEQKNIMFPPCNIEWKANIGTKVWCTKNSGGISRDWVGVPRILFEKPKSKQNRCACVNIDSDIYKEMKGNIEQYDGCPEDATSCTVELSE